MLDLGKTSYKDLDFVRVEFFSVVGATKYINVLDVQILIWKHNNFARVTSEPKNPFKCSI